MMNTITDEESRQLLLQKLKELIYLETSLWDICSGIIDDIFEFGYGSLDTLMKITSRYAGKDLAEEDLHVIRR